MAFLVAVGGLQFAYCVLVGNYVGFPFPRFVCVYIRIYIPLLGVEGTVLGRFGGGKGGGGVIKIYGRRC